MQEKAFKGAMCNSAQNLLIFSDYFMNENETKASETIQAMNAKFCKKENDNDYCCSFGNVSHHDLRSNPRDG